MRSPLIMLLRLRSYSVLKCRFLKLYLTLDVSVEFWGRKRNQTWFCVSFAFWIAGVQRLLPNSAGPSGPARLSAGIKMLRTLKFGNKMIPSSLFCSCLIISTGLCCCQCYIMVVFQSNPNPNHISASLWRQVLIEPMSLAMSNMSSVSFRQML